MTIEVVEAIQSLQNGFLDVFFNFISFLGEEYVYIVLFSIIYFAFDKKLGEFAGLVLFFTGMFNAIIKGLVMADRPFQKYPDRVTNLRPETSGGYSFPSGHTQMFSAFTFSGAIHYHNRLAMIIAAVLSGLMAISRMYLGVHFLEDVLMSLVLGITTAFLFHAFFKKLRDNDRALHRIYITILIAFLPFLVLLNYEDLFKTYGLMLGFTIGIQLEKKYVQFSMDIAWWKKALRVVGGLILMVVIMVGLGALFDQIADEGTTLLNILDGIRYALISLIGLGVYPLFFKKLHL